MPKSTKPISRFDEKRSGVTLIEILIVTVIIGLMASLSFPAFKIMQQREKERRLRKILTDVRAAIAGSKSQQSTTAFEEGYRTFVRVKGIQEIEDRHPGTTPEQIATKTLAISCFVDNLAADGLGYPLTPSALTDNPAPPITVGTAPISLCPIVCATDSVKIIIDRRFLRTLPPHPFQNWYPTARWEFKPATSNPTVTSLAFNAAQWPGGVGPDTATGVADIVSRGAGMGLDGSQTDGW